MEVLTLYTTKANLGLGLAVRGQDLRASVSGLRVRVKGLGSVVRSLGLRV